MSICPNCGYRHANNDFAPELMELRLQNRQREVLLRLSQAQGAWVRSTSLIDFIYGDIEREPKDARLCTHVHVAHTRRQIEPHGWTIESERQRGYRLIRMEGQAK